MPDLHAVAQTSLTKACAKLQDAAGIGGNNDVGLHGKSLTDLALAQTAAHLRVREVVDTRTTAAEGGFAHLSHAQPRNSAQ